jgi:hypothetical protein
MKIFKNFAQIIDRRSSPATRGEWCLRGILKTLQTILLSKFVKKRLWKGYDVRNLVSFRLNDILFSKTLAGIHLLGRR